jgi:hypothetical protein
VTAGTYPLGLQAVTGGWNLNWVRITPTGSAATARAAATATTTLASTDGELEVYPNPATTQLLLRSARSLVGSRYQILNALGQVVASGTAEAGSLDVSHLAPGLYTLRLTAEGQQVSRRFIK